MWWPFQVQKPKRVISVDEVTAIAERNLPWFSELSLPESAWAHEAIKSMVIDIRREKYDPRR